MINKICKPELLFLCTSFRLDMLHIPMKSMKFQTVKEVQCEWKIYAVVDNS